jgi:hypothetical protein
VDQRREIRLVCHIKEDGKDPREESGANEEWNAEPVREVGNRYDKEECGTTEVANNEDAAARESVDRSSCDQAEEEEGEEVGKVEDGNLKRTSGERGDRDQWEGNAGDA